MNHTIEELNKIQGEWMALETSAPENEKARVYRLMDKCPKSHLTYDHARAFGAWSVVFQGGPVTTGVSKEQAVEIAQKHGIQTNAVWTTSGCWIENKGNT